MRWLVCLCLLLAGALHAEPVKFGDRLHAKFQHDRCLQCHQFNSRKNNGRTFTSHRSRYLCAQCHTAELTGLNPGEWFAPEERLDHTGLSPQATCRAIKGNLHNDDKRIVAHLLIDKRVRWALESGMTPGGQKEKVPGGFKEWEADVRAWVKDGMRCE